MNRTVIIVLALASLAGCAAAPKPVVASSTSESPRKYDQSEYTSPEEKEIYVSSPQETQARKDTHQDGLQPSLVTARKAKQLYPLGH